MNQGSELQTPKEEGKVKCAMCWKKGQQRYGPPPQNMLGDRDFKTLSNELNAEKVNSKDALHW